MPKIEFEQFEKCRGECPAYTENAHGRPFCALDTHYNGHVNDPIYNEILEKALDIDGCVNHYIFSHNKACGYFACPVLYWVNIANGDN